MKLNLGCGSDIRKGYINIDIRKLPNVDLVLDIEHNKLPYTDESVEEILAKDIIEHFSFRNIRNVLKEWYRVLKKGGILIIQTPDFERIADKFFKGEINGWYELSYWLFGAQDHQENTHKAIFTKSELKKLLEEIGFEVVEIWNDNSNIICKAVKR